MSERVTNLTFHGIGQPPSHLDNFGKEFWVTEETFRFVVSESADRPDVRITFDDGNLSDYEIAFPILLDEGMTADFFACMGLIGQEGHLRKEMILEMLSAGMRFGSHGYDHRPWRNLDDQELHREIVEARADLEELTQTRIGVAACPFGDYDSRVLRKLKEAQFERVYTSDKGRAWSDNWLQSRNALRNWHTRDEIHKILSPSPFREMESRVKTFFKKLR